MLVFISPMRREIKLITSDDLPALFPEGSSDEIIEKMKPGLKNGKYADGILAGGLYVGDILTKGKSNPVYDWFMVGLLLALCIFLVARVYLKIREMRKEGPRMETIERLKREKYEKLEEIKSTDRIKWKIED